MSKGTAFGMLLAAAWVVSGCASTEKILLLPNQDGTPSSLVVKTASGEQVIDQPYAGASIGARGAIQSETVTAETVQAKYASTLSAQPQRQATYVLYFPLDSVVISSDSRATLERVKEDLRSRAVPEIMVVGHTDAIGDDAYNDALSLERAKALSKLLFAEGLPSENLTVAGRGRREPVVKTAPGKREPLNRRVEIIVK